MKKFIVLAHVERVTVYEKLIEAPDEVTAAKLADDALDDGVEDWKEVDQHTTDMSIVSVEEEIE